jgi:hypothetical protein
LPYLPEAISWSNCERAEASKPRSVAALVSVGFSCAEATWKDSKATSAGASFMKRFIKRGYCIGFQRMEVPVRRLLDGAEVFDELGGVEGFGEEFEVVATLAGAGKDFYGGGLTAEEDDAGRRGEFADRDGGFNAVDVRHEDVGQDEFRGGAAGCVNGLLTAVRCFSEEAAAIEDLDDGVGDEGFVVYDKDAGQDGGLRRFTVRQDGGSRETLRRVVGGKHGCHRGLGEDRIVRQVYSAGRHIAKVKN